VTVLNPNGCRWRWRPGRRARAKSRQDESMRDRSPAPSARRGPNWIVADD
jgi:hypothetical protein